MKIVMIKRSLILMIALLMAAAGVCVYAEEDQTDIPPAIKELMASSLNSGYRVQSFNEMSTGEWSAAALQTADGHNLLYLFRCRNNKWSLYLKSESIIFQGTKFVNAYFGEGTSIFYTGRQDLSFQITTPLLTIGQMNSDQAGIAEYYERSVSFTLKDGRWLLVSWEDFDFNSVFISGDAMYYSGSWLAEFEPWYGKVDGTVQRDIRWASIRNIPRTYQEAKKKVTLAPDIPSGELTAQDIRFAGGKKYPVYSAPDKTSVRGGNGKAAVSTNGWIQVFGRENDWILIQYSIDNEHYRFGYIDAASLPKKASVHDLNFQGSPAWTTGEAIITDDPLYSRTALKTLNGGTQVTLLSTMGNWAYIEYNAEEHFRGFVDQSLLRRE